MKKTGLLFLAIAFVTTAAYAQPSNDECFTPIVLTDVSDFCSAAGGPWARREVRDLIHELEAVDHALGGQGGMGLPAALKWATEQSA